MINPDDLTPANFKDIGELLPGIQFMDLPAGSQALEAVILIKCLDEDGHVGWIQRWTSGLHLVEVLGATSAMRALNESNVVALYEDD